MKRNARMVAGVAIGLLVASGTAFATTVDTDALASDSSFNGCVTPAKYVRILNEGEECRRREVAIAFPSPDALLTVAEALNETSDALDALAADFADYADADTAAFDEAIAELTDTKATVTDLADEIERASDAEATLADELQANAEDLQAQIDDITAGIADQTATLSLIHI